MHEVLSAGTDFCYISDVPAKNAEEVKARCRQTRPTPWFQQHTSDDPSARRCAEWRFRKDQP